MKRICNSTNIKTRKNTNKNNNRRNKHVTLFLKEQMAKANSDSDKDTMITKTQKIYANFEMQEQQETGCKQC